MKITKPFKAVLEGEIYPEQFNVGDECPPELVATAKALGALELPKEKGKDGADIVK